jgi:hypothetical protein
MRRLFIVIPALALACGEPTEPADPERALITFAETMAADVYNAMWDHVDQETVELWHHEDGASFSGTIELPTASGESYGVDGELVLDWSMLFEIQDEMEGIYLWSWDVEADIDRLVVPECELSGAGEWTVDQETYDYSWKSHRFVGQLALEDGELQDVEVEFFYSGNLHWVRGTIGETEVDWENPNADEC